MYRRLICFILIVIILFVSLLDIKTDKPNEEKYISVEVRGEVKQETLLNIKLGSTFNDVLSLIELSDNSDISMFSINEVLHNNQIIVIPSKSTNKLISINSATIEELCSLPGIGEKIAERIIEYRNNYGSFNRVDEIKNIKGIGNNKYERIKELIGL